MRDELIKLRDAALEEHARGETKDFAELFGEGLTKPIYLTVFGKPQTAGSKRAFPFKRKDGRLAVAVSDDNPNSRDWKNAVASAAREVFGGELLDCPLALSLVFYLPRPKGHFGKRGLRPAAPGYPAVKPDVLKLARCVEDSLTQVVWRDDSQIVLETLQKRYGEPARVEIEIKEML